MIAGLIRWSARNLLLVLVGTLAVVGGGLYAVGHISRCPTSRTRR
jgi:hypothetical protein